MASKHQAQTKRVGRPPRGDREPYTVRLERRYKAIYEAAAAAAGFDSLSDYIDFKMAMVHDLDQPSYINSERNQLTLDVAV